MPFAFGRDADGGTNILHYVREHFGVTAFGPELGSKAARHAGQLAKETESNGA